MPPRNNISTTDTSSASRVYYGSLIAAAGGDDYTYRDLPILNQERRTTNNNLSIAVY